jgi:hypothetical protein
LKSSASPLQVGEEIIRSVDDVAIEWSAEPESVIEQNDLFDGIDRGQRLQIGGSKNFSKNWLTTLLLT